MKDEKELIIPLKRMGKRKKQIGIIVTTPGITSAGVDFGMSFQALLLSLVVSVASSAVVSMALVFFLFWLATE